MNYVTCPDCIEYGEIRFPAIVPALAAHCRETGEDSRAALNRYMAGVHDRHLSGLPILPSAS